MSKEEENLKALSTMSSIAQPPSPPPWVELPLEITANILKRLGAIEILRSAQRVCTTWWNVCRHEPSMWHVIDTTNCGSSIKTEVLEEMCRVAVDRSQGELRKISIVDFGTRELLTYIAERSSQLRHLRLVDCYDCLAGGLAATAKNFPLLEELHVFFTLITTDDIESVGRSCSLLESFTLNPGNIFDWPAGDEQAIAIARSMPVLRHLVLDDKNLSNEGLQAILDGCPHLESHDYDFGSDYDYDYTSAPGLGDYSDYSYDYDF